MSNRRFAVFACVIAGLGFAIGHWLSGIQHLQPAKLLNVVGLFYDMLAVTVLSELASSSMSWKSFAVSVIAPGILWLHILFPLGALLGAGLSRLQHLPSSATVAAFAFGIFAYSMLPALVLESTIALPRFARFKGLDSRWRWFGLLLLASGVGVQFVAAILSLRA